VAAAVAAARADGLPVKPIGSGHSFTDTAVTTGVAIDLSALATPPTVDRAGRRVTVPAGMSLRALNALLARHELALPNLGDIDAQTVAGAVATGTHGTGAGLGNLATFVAALELVTADGTVLCCSAGEHPDVFRAGLIGLGALGVVTALTLRCVDAFWLHADERPAGLADTLSTLDELAAANDHVEFYWLPYTDRTLVKRNNRVGAGTRTRSRLRTWWEHEAVQNVAFGAVCRAGRAAPGLVPALLRGTARLVTPVSYTARSDRVFVSRRRVRFTEMEYALPRAALPEAFTALRGIVDRLPFPVQFPVEVRVVAGDDIWLSPGYRRDSAYIAIHQYVGAPYAPYFKAFERICTGLDGRPHWGKLHWRDAASLAPAYPRFADFLAVRDKLDPDRVFGNAYTERVLGP
jgi:L-gulonolactone oxidase